MSLTIERPETEARLIRFATSRGLTPLDALDELLDEVEGEEPEDLSAIPGILMHPAPDAMKKALADMDAGKGISGADFLAELRRPVSEMPHPEESSETSRA
jgi:hypothetical protein